MARAQHKSSLFVILIMQSFFLCIILKERRPGLLEAGPFPPFVWVRNEGKRGVEPNGRIQVLSTVHFSCQLLKHCVHIITTFHKLVDEDAIFCVG